MSDEAKDGEELNAIAEPQPSPSDNPEPEDDTMLPMREVVRLTGISDSTIKRAWARVADWEAEHEEHQRSDALNTRFQGATAAEVIKMWETGKNEHGRKLSQFEFGSLVERWCQVFGALPPDDGEELNAIAEPQPREHVPLTAAPPEAHCPILVLVRPTSLATRVHLATSDATRSLKP